MSHLAQLSIDFSEFVIGPRIAIVATDVVCGRPDCGRQQIDSRGLCKSCYGKCAHAVRKGRTQICGTSRKSTHIGLFQSEEDAARAYDAAARQEFGEFASLNF